MTRYLFITLVLLVSSAQALEQNYFKPENYDLPKRELSIIVTDEGYYPVKPTVFAGEKIRLYITSTKSDPSCFIVKDKEVYVGAHKGEISEAEVVFNRPGVYETYCPAGQLRGKIIVLEHPKIKQKEIERKLASINKKKVKIWRPKDE
jgi:plastocyanin